MLFGRLFLWLAMLFKPGSGCGLRHDRQHLHGFLGHVVEDPNVVNAQPVLGRLEQHLRGGDRRSGDESPERERTRRAATIRPVGSIAGFGVTSRGERRRERGT